MFVCLKLGEFRKCFVCLLVLWKANRTKPHLPAGSICITTAFAICMNTRRPLYIHHGKQVPCVCVYTLSDLGTYAQVHYISVWPHTNILFYCSTHQQTRSDLFVSLPSGEKDHTRAQNILPVALREISLTRRVQLVFNMRLLPKPKSLLFLFL